MSAFSTRLLAKKPWAAFVFALYWHANGMLPPMPSPIYFNSSLNRWPRRAFLNAVLSTSRSVQCSTYFHHYYPGRPSNDTAIPREHVKAPRPRDSGALQESQAIHPIQEFSISTTAIESSICG